ncbi:MAG: glycosyl hydrolase [Planctomycetota bacterium]
MNTIEGIKELMQKRQKQTLKFSVMFVVLMFSCMFLRCAYGEKAPELTWPEVTRETKPWTYWWWLGSAVDKEGLTEHLEAYHKAGMGGVHVIPIYGVRGKEERFIEYLSPRWMEMLAHTAREAERLDMGVDMSTGTGWPFGGPNVDAEDATAKVIFRTYSVSVGGGWEEPLRIKDEGGEKAQLQALMGFSDRADILDLTAKVNEDGTLIWDAPVGRWKLYAVFQGLGGKKVERAAPGGAGYIIDPFSHTALRNYLGRFDRAFADYEGGLPRAHYHDSYEYGRATWTDNLFEEFEERRGYDLRKSLPALLGEGDEDVVARVKCDYRETIADLHLESYIMPWVQWCHEKGGLTRNQAHGSPSNLLDVYAAADIPETEIFGPSGFGIPGLRIDPDFSFHAALNDPLMLKFASSAAHVTGKKLVSSESCTWLGEHFKVALSQCKPEIDQLFISGINHIFYHGMAYSPFDEPWPGWLFYASTNFAPSNSFWRDFPELNSYIARCQSNLQAGRPDNDILLYWPIYDVWHNKDGMLMNLAVHNIGGWMYGSEFYKTAKLLWDRGYTFDYVSDQLLADAKVSSRRIQMGGGEYRVLVVPQCRFMPLGTLKKLMSLANAGATIIVQGGLPGEVPGFGDLENRREHFKRALAPLPRPKSEDSAFCKKQIGKGSFLVGKELERMLELSEVVREPIVHTAGVEFIRRRYPQGHHYFLANLGKERLDEWVSLGVRAKSVVVFDSLTGEQRLPALREAENGQTQVYLQLQPGQSCILRTFTSRLVDGPKWRYLQKIGEPCEVKGNWQVTFLDGGPELPGSFETKNLSSWTELGDEEAKRFAGTACYKVTFDKPAIEADDWVLDLGRVCESACVRINGRHVGTLWSIPFRIPVGGFLREGENMLEVEVTNLSANRIADMDRREVNWKKFYEINFVNIGYRKFDASGWPAMDSGLLGPVRLIPSLLMEP